MVIDFNEASMKLKITNSKNTKNKYPQLGLRLAPEHVKILDELAKKLGVSRTDVVRMAILEFSKKR